MELSVENVFGLLLRSRLLSADDARALFERWRERAKDAADAADFARWMVAGGHLTEYQATLLARGHADGFFVDEYKILDRLGKGRMAGVYKAVHSLGQVVAVKVLPPSKGRDPRLLARFRREARLALRLKHANVVRAFHMGYARGLHYLVMECLEGETLAEVLQRRGKLPPAEAVRVAYQALLGLQHLHEQGVVHRDLKPANLMMLAPPGGNPDTTADATVKILDMSLARALTGEDDADDVEDPRLTTEGALLGTPDYMAPEQARDAHAADVRADVYSLGCVLYHALAGRPPFQDSNIISQMIRHASEAPRPLQEFNPAVPDGLQQILNWMLAKDPAKRYATPGRAAQALQVFLAAGEDVPGLDADPKMRSYLTWLEDSQERPKLVGMDDPPPAAPETPAPEPEGRRRRKRKKVTRDPEPAPFDFGAALAPPPKEPAAAPRLSRRDCLMFGAGAGSVLMAILLGGLVALLLRGS